MRKLKEHQEFQTWQPSGAEGDAAARLKEFQSLSADIVGFFHTQIFAPSVYDSNEKICQAFSDILLRQWDLCTIITFMRHGAEQPLREFHAHISENLNQEKARAAAALLAAAVANAGKEQRLWLDQKQPSGRDQSTLKLRRVFTEANLSCGIGVPIYASEATPVGILVAMASSPILLGEAIDGIRLIAEPLTIALGNAQRVKAIHEQRRQIEHLVEELEQSNVALKDANQQLQRVSLYRSLFLARMSHELRTPLTSILGFAEILLDQERLTETQQRFCEKIQSSGLQLQSSLKQLVDLSRLEAGRTEMFLHEFSLRETLRESCSAVSPLARKRQVLLDCQSALDLPPIVSDEGKMRQVFYNFLAHAIGRSAPGQNIFVSATRPEAHRFAVIIRDEGERIADPSTVFESMDAMEPGAAGTNLNELGLSIARRLVDALGGRMRLESAGECGLSVCLDFPASL